MTRPERLTPMPKHQPTPEELTRLQQAHMDVSAGEEAVAEARATLAQAIADQSQRTLALSRAIDDVVYGPQDDAPKPRTGSAYQLSSPLAQQHWPSPPAAPGG